VPPPNFDGANRWGHGWGEGGDGDRDAANEWNAKGKGGKGKGGKGKGDKGKGDKGKGGKGKGDKGKGGKGGKGSKGGKGKGGDDADEPKQKIYQHGNYPGYYHYRDSGKEDPRLQYLQPEWFKDKDVLDIGCHCGEMAIQVATKFKTRSVHGVDIDSKLVKQAQGHAWYLEGLNVHFAAVSYIEGPIPEAPLYDAIYCLSVTKWIHFNSGDAGVKKLFQKVFASLRPGGVFILEPQPWKSYKKKYAWQEDWKANYQKIELKPGLFKHHLVNEVGFSRFELLGQSEVT